MSIFKTPKAPDPYKTAAAQQATNVSTATAQQLLNQTDQVGPYGSVNYSQHGTASYTDPATGQVIKIPQFTQTTTLSPEQQALLEQENAFDKASNQIAIDQTGRIKDVLSKPLDLNNEATEGRLMELGRKRLDPMWAERESAFDTKMANSGIQAGSDAYKKARAEFDQGRNDSYNSLLLSGRGQAVNEALTERNQPINETTALMGAGQVQQPQFATAAPQAGVNGVDLAGMIMNNYNQQMGTRNAMLGGLAGMGGAALGGWGQSGFALSDKRAKKNIKKVGKAAKGIGIYKYDYKGESGASPFQRLGVMAQEVDDKVPEAVGIDPKTGMRMVNYSKLAQALSERPY